MSDSDINCYTMRVNQVHVLLERMYYVRACLRYLDKNELYTLRMAVAIIC